MCFGMSFPAHVYVHPRDSLTCSLQDSNKCWRFSLIKPCQPQECLQLMGRACILWLTWMSTWYWNASLLQSGLGHFVAHASQKCSRQHWLWWGVFMSAWHLVQTCAGLALSSALVSWNSCTAVVVCSGCWLPIGRLVLSSNYLHLRGPI